MNESTPITKKRLFEILQKSGNYAVGITLLLYIIGFIITNMRLGSLGIVNLDLLKARYILAGFLFCFFISSIAYLIYGLKRTLQKHEGKPVLNVILRVSWYSASSISIIYLLIYALATLSGYNLKTLSDTPIFPMATPVSTWISRMNTAPMSVLFVILLLYCVIWLLAIIGCILVLIINPKNSDGTRKTRREIITNLFKDFWSNKGRVIGWFLGFTLVFYILIFILSFLGSTTRITNLSMISSTSAPFEGWARFIEVIVASYLLAILYYTFFSKSPLKYDDPDFEVFSERTSVYLYWGAIILVVIGTAYTIGIYPYLPQQIGGGQVIQVEANISNNELKQTFTDSSKEVYLIDRASDSTLFLLLDTTNNEHQVVEVTNDLIQSITYKPSP